MSAKEKKIRAMLRALSATDDVTFVCASSFPRRWRANVLAAGRTKAPPACYALRVVNICALSETQDILPLIHSSQLACCRWALIVMLRSGREIPHKSC